MPSPVNPARCALALVLAVACAARPLRADEPAPAARFAALATELVGDDAPARPPYALARYDLGLDPEQAARVGAPASGDTLEARTARVLPGLAELARVRQQRLEHAWDQSKRDAWRPTDQVGLAAWALVAYAFGESPLAPAQAAARGAGPDAELRLARLLLAECSFPDAVASLVALADGASPAADAAFALLVRHSLERRFLARHVTLVGVGCDLDREVHRLGARPARAGLAAALRDRTRLAVSAFPHGPEVREDPRELADLPVEADDTDEITELESVAAQLARRLALRAGTQATPYLQTVADELLLYAREDWRIAGQAQSVRLASRCGGPIALALHRVADENAWRAVTPETLATQPPIARFERELRPLHRNNHVTPDEDVEVALGELPDGYYVVTAWARHCPVMAAVKLAVSRVRLYLRAGSNTAVVVALDRGGHRPMSGVPIELVVTGEPDVASLAGAEEEPRRGAWTDGFLGRSVDGANATAGDPGVRLAPASLLERARDHARGAAARARFPTRRHAFTGATDANGAIAFPLDLCAPDYRYRLVARCVGGGPATAEVVYQHHRAAPRTRVLVWCAQPIHRPGETAQLCGIVRRFDGLTVLPHDLGWRADVALEVKGRGGVLWSGRAALSPVGVFEAEIPIPADAPLGNYDVLVDGTDAEPDAPLRIEELRLPTLAIELTLDRRTYAGGEVATGVVRVLQANGSPASGAPVELVLETGVRRPRSVVIETGHDGSARFELPLPQIPDDRGLLLRAIVGDSGGQAITAKRRVDVKASSFGLYAETQPDPAPREGRAAVHVQARAWDGTPLEGVVVVLAGHPQAARTDAQGEARLLVATARGGDTQTLHVSALRGAEVVSQTVTLRLAAEFGGKPDHADDLDLAVADVDRGQPLAAKLRVDERSGGRSTVLVFVENDRLLDWRVLELDPGEHRLELPTTTDHAPGVELCAVAINARRSLRDSCSAYVRPIEQFLALELETDRTSYKPGETCRTRLVAKDHAGRPVAGAQLALGVVDTSIYELREDPTPDVAEYFWRFHPPHLPVGALDGPPPGAPSLLWWRGPAWAWGVPDTATASEYVYESRSGGRMWLAKRGGGGMATEVRLPPLRSDFRTTAHWVAHLVTGADGVATTRFAFPDGITRWRFTARGVTADTRVGQLRRTARTLLPLEVDLALPRALRDGDRVQAACVVTDHAGAARRVKLVHAGDAAPGELNLELAAKGAARTTVALHPRGLSPLVLEVGATDLATSDGDRVQRTLAVSPRGHELHAQRAGSMAEGGTIALPGPGAAGPTRVTVATEPSLAAVVDRALDGLVDYPYGCVEQTMGRFLPAVVAAQARAKMGGAIAQADRLPDVLAKSLARLAAMQHSDGGWGWWSHDASNPYLTAYVLEGLALCRGAGHPVPARMVDRGAAWLLDQLEHGRADGGWVGRMGAVDVATQAVAALARVYAPDLERRTDERRRLGALVPVRDPGTPSERALLATSWRLLGDGARATELVRAALDAVPTGKLDRAATIALARVVEAGIPVLPDDPRWNALAHRLILARRGPGWGDTLVSAQAIRALCARLDVAGADAGALRVEVDGRLVATLEPTGPRVHVLSAELDGARELRLVPTRPGAAGWWSADLHGWTREPPATPATPDLAIAVTCRRALGDGAALAIRDGTLLVRVGETIEITLELTARADASHLVLSWPRPAGVELVRPPARDATVIDFEQRDLALELFLGRIAAGETARISFWVRAEHAGELFAPGPRVQAMYGDAPAVAVDAPRAWTVAAR